MFYAVDLVRGVYFWGQSEYEKVVIYHPLLNFSILIILFLAFLITGTYIFVKSEKER
jgi:hypothetical protein